MIRDGWERLPIDDVGYLPASALLAWPDTDLVDLVAKMAEVRYHGWRNHNGLWRDVLGLDSTHGKLVLDFGCGVGLEALQYAQAGNRVWLADLTIDGIDLAARVLALHEQLAAGTSRLLTVPPFIYWPKDQPRFDVIHLAGVLHHIREPRPVMVELRRWLTNDGEVRLMVYSDEGWRVATGSEPPDQVEHHPDFDRYVEFMDSVGDFADWYSLSRLKQRFGDLFWVDRCEYLTPDRRYLAAVLRRKEPT